jgi:hypothetical protein
MIDKLDKMSELKYVSICLLLSALTSTFAYLAAQDEVRVERDEVEEAFAPEADFDDNDSANLEMLEDCESWRIYEVGGE